jgi:hypothetical protein
MPMLDPSRAVVPVINGKKKAIERCCAIRSKGSQQLAEAPERIQTYRCGDAPRERRDGSHMLQVQARGQQRRGCIRSPVVSPSS